MIYIKTIRNMEGRFWGACFTAIHCFLSQFSHVANEASLTWNFLKVIVSNWVYLSSLLNISFPALLLDLASSDSGSGINWAINCLRNFFNVRPFCFSSGWDSLKRINEFATVTSMIQKKLFPPFLTLSIEIIVRVKLVKHFYTTHILIK